LSSQSQTRKNKFAKNKKRCLDGFRQTLFITVKIYTILLEIKPAGKYQKTMLVLLLVILQVNLSKMKIRLAKIANIKQLNYG